MQLNSNKRIAINALSSGTQIIITGLVFFFLYRIIYQKLGADLIGIWSLILATSSIANLANFGITSGQVKFVAEYNATGEKEKIIKLIFTSFASMIVFLMFMVIIVYILAHFFLILIIDSKYIDLALKILPISLLCLVINSLSGIFTSTLEGFQKNYIRNIIYIIGSIVFLAGSILLLPYSGLFGLAIAQLSQAILIFILSLINVYKIFPDFQLFKWNWDRGIFKSLFSYGYKFQIVTICQMLFEPITKILISIYSGVGVLGFYEMASRFVNQFRAVVSTMNGITIPIVSHYYHTDKSQIKYIYERSLSFIIFLVFPIVAGIVLITPHLSKIWIGGIEPIFINTSYILASSMLVNILNAPAYYNSLGEGNLNGLLIMHLLMAFLNISLGIGFGIYIKTYGVIIGLASAYAIGSVYLMYYYHKRNNFKLKDIINKSEFILIIVGLVFSLVSVFVFTKFSHHYNYNLFSLIILMLVFIFIFAPLLYRNKNFKSIKILWKKS
jgi:O-antigen/teichoic acid export membrane protein